MKKAIYSALDKNLKRRTDMERLHLFPDEEIPEEIKMNFIKLNSTTQTNS